MLVESVLLLLLLLWVLGWREERIRANKLSTSVRKSGVSWEGGREARRWRAGRVVAGKNSVWHSTEGKRPSIPERCEEEEEEEAEAGAAAAPFMRRVSHEVQVSSCKSTVNAWTAHTRGGS